MSRVYRLGCVTAALTAYSEPELALAAAVLAQMVEDIRGVKCSAAAQQDARAFLYSAWCEFLCDGLGLSYYQLRHMTRSI